MINKENRIMIFEIEKSGNKNNLDHIKRVSLQTIGWNEKDLENIIAKNIQELIPENQLMILAQERSFQEEADILALDEKGNLYIFELKRWQSNKENILQVLRYGQKFGQYSYLKLAELYKKYRNKSGSDKEVNLKTDHYEYFKDSLEEELDENKFNQIQHFIVITDGADIETLNAIQYWKDMGINIEASPYRVYEINGAKLFEFNKYNPKNDVMIDLDSEIYVVNSNLTWSKTNYIEMLRDEKASAYYDKKFTVDKIKKGDKVFLFHTGAGIIAYGKAISDVQIKDTADTKGEEHYIKLKFDWKIDPDLEPQYAVKAYEINNILSTGHRFRQTCFSINKEMADAIEKISLEKKPK